MTDPLKYMDILEDIKAMQDIGKMGYHIFAGALQEGATDQEAFLVVSAYYAGMFADAARQSRENDEETPSS